MPKHRRDKKLAVEAYHARKRAREQKRPVHKPVIEENQATPNMGDKRDEDERLPLPG